MAKKKLTIAVFGAHPDDIEISMAGTLIKYKEQGHDVRLVIATDGRRASRIKVDTWQELVEIRRKEAIAAAAHIGVMPEFLDFEDGRLIYTIESYEKVSEVCNQINPDIVFTHDIDDYHPDHRAISKLVTDSTWAPVLFTDKFGGAGFNPEFYVDISEQYELKKKMAKEFVSQIDKNYDSSFLSVFEIQNRFRGMQFGLGSSKYAEAFRLYPRYQWINSNVHDLLPD